MVGRLKAYEEIVKEEDKANDTQENLLCARTDNSHMNNMTQAEEDDVVHTLEVVAMLVVKVVDVTTLKIMVNVTP